MPAGFSLFPLLASVPPALKILAQTIMILCDRTKLLIATECDQGVDVFGARWFGQRRRPSSACAKVFEPLQKRGNLCALLSALVRHTGSGQQSLDREALGDSRRLVLLVEHYLPDLGRWELFGAGKRVTVLRGSDVPGGEKRQHCSVHRVLRPAVGLAVESFVQVGAFSTHGADRGQDFLADGVGGGFALVSDGIRASGAPSRALVRLCPSWIVASTEFREQAISDRLAAVSTAPRSDEVVTSVPPPWKTRAWAITSLKSVLSRSSSDATRAALRALRPCPHRSAGWTLLHRVLCCRVAGKRLLDLVDVSLREKDEDDGTLVTRLAADFFTADSVPTIRLASIRALPIGGRGLLLPPVLLDLPRRVADALGELEAR